MEAEAADAEKTESCDDKPENQDVEMREGGEDGTYLHTYTMVCVCVCVLTHRQTNTDTQTNTCMHKYMFNMNSISSFDHVFSRTYVNLLFVTQYIIFCKTISHQTGPKE